VKSSTLAGAFPECLRQDEPCHADSNDPWLESLKPSVTTCLDENSVRTAVFTAINPEAGFFWRRPRYFERI
jgi:hypothetical protein